MQLASPAMSIIHYRHDPIPGPLSLCLCFQLYSLFDNIAVVLAHFRWWWWPVSRWCLRLHVHIGQFYAVIAPQVRCLPHVSVVLWIFTSMQITTWTINRNRKQKTENHNHNCGTWNNLKPKNKLKSLILSAYPYWQIATTTSKGHITAHGKLFCCRCDIIMFLFVHCAHTYPQNLQQQQAAKSHSQEQQQQHATTDIDDPQALPISKFSIDKKTKQKETPQATTIILGASQSHSKFSAWHPRRFATLFHKQDPK